MFSEASSRDGNVIDVEVDNQHSIVIKNAKFEMTKLCFDSLK